jgi:hypothetical protein
MTGSGCYESESRQYQFGTPTKAKSRIRSVGEENQSRIRRLADREGNSVDNSLIN